MVKKVPGWVEVMVRACLEAMGEFEEDEGSGSGLDAWLAEDVGLLFVLMKLICYIFIQPSSNSNSSDTESPPTLYEQSLDRLACAMGGKVLLPPAFQVGFNHLHNNSCTVHLQYLCSIFPRC